MKEEHNINLSRGDLIALSQEWSGRDVKYARLEMRYEMLEEKLHEQEEKHAISEAARNKAEEEVRQLKTINEQQQHDIELLKLKIAGMASSIEKPDIETLQQAIEFLLQNHVLISILQLKAFMQDRVTDLNTALVLRAFVLECVPEKLQATSLAIINKVMVLPEKTKSTPTTIDNRKINLFGDNSIYKENPKE